MTRYGPHKTKLEIPNKYHLQKLDVIITFVYFHSDTIEQRLTADHPWPNLAHHLFLSMQFSWHTATSLIYLLSMSASMLQQQLWQTRKRLHKLNKIFTPWLQVEKTTCPSAMEVMQAAFFSGNIHKWKLWEAIKRHVEEDRSEVCTQLLCRESAETKRKY